MNSTASTLYMRVSEFCINRRLNFLCTPLLCRGYGPCSGHNPEHSLGSLFGDYRPLWGEVEKVGQRAKRRCWLTDRSWTRDKVTADYDLRDQLHLHFGSVEWLENVQPRYRSADKDILLLVKLPLDYLIEWKKIEGSIT